MDTQSALTFTCCGLRNKISQHRRHLSFRLILWDIIIVFAPFLLAACQSPSQISVETYTLIPTATSIPNLTPTDAATLTETPTSTPTETPLPTEASSTEADNGGVTPTVHPCYVKLFPIDKQYPNPQENLDPNTGTTWMMITLEDGILSAQDSYHYWWDTRAFSQTDSFNIGDGPCEVLLETNQIKCEGIPLKGTDNLPTGGYEYDFKIYIQGYKCQAAANYQQGGLIFMNTMDHDVFMINGEAVH